MSKRIRLPADSCALHARLTHAHEQLRDRLLPLVPAQNVAGVCGRNMASFETVQAGGAAHRLEHMTGHPLQVSVWGRTLSGAIFSSAR
jgi:hypothetical protein